MAKTAAKATRRTTKRRTASPARKRMRKAASTLTSAAKAVRGTVSRGVAAVVERASRRGTGTDAIDLLERDHRRLEELLKEGEETTARAVKGRRTLLKTITGELGAHELKEEQVLYPALKRHAEAKAIVLDTQTKANTTIPWHPGAAKYFTEAGAKM